VTGFLKLLLSAMWVCVCACLPLRLLITSDMIGCDMEPLWLVRQVVGFSLSFMWQLKSLQIHIVGGCGFCKQSALWKLHIIDWLIIDLTLLARRETVQQQHNTTIHYNAIQYYMFKHTYINTILHDKIHTIQHYNNIQQHNIITD